MALESFLTWQVVLLGTLFIVIFGGACTATIIILMRKRFPFHVEIWKDVPPYGSIQVQKTRARLIKVGDGGEQIYLLKKPKVYRIAYGKFIGNKKIAWAISNDDDYWYNVGFTPVEKSLRQIGTIPVHRDMRLGNTNMRKIIEKKYDDRSFMEKFAVPITIGMLIFAIVIQLAGFYFILDKGGEVLGGFVESSKVNKETMEVARQLIINLDRLKGGSGIIQDNGL
jgi:hypothetical protein